jgi:hypothetical protein
VRVWQRQTKALSYDTFFQSLDAVLAASLTMVLALPMAALSLSVAAPRRAAAAQPARLAGGVKAVSLSARRCDALSAGAVALRRPAAAPKAAARAVPTEAKLKTRKSAAKRYKVTASGKVRSLPASTSPSRGLASLPWRHRRAERQRGAARRATRRQPG